MAFNRIHASLKKMVKGRIDKFSHLVSQRAKSYSLILTYEDDLYQFAKLRNAMVHDKREIGYYIAEPHEDIVKQIEKIAFFFEKALLCIKDCEQVHLF